MIGNLIITFNICVRVRTWAQTSETSVIDNNMRWLCVAIIDYIRLKLKLYVSSSWSKNVTDLYGWRHLVRVQAGQLQDGVKLWWPLLCCLTLAHDENIAGYDYNSGPCLGRF